MPKSKTSKPIPVESYLKGMDYPASKEDCIECASSNQAPDEVISALEGMPERQYGSPTDVSKGIDGR